MKDAAATKLITPRATAATPRPFGGRTDGGAANGCAGPAGCAVLTMHTFRLSSPGLDVPPALPRTCRRGWMR